MKSATQQHSSYLPLCFTLLALLLLGAGSASAVITVTLENEQGAFTNLTVGEDLYVKITNNGLAATGPIDLTLRDDAPVSFTIKTRQIADLAPGETTTALLWDNTGVGCDPCEDPDPTEYRFKFLADADTTLDGQTLHVDVAYGNASSTFSFTVDALGQASHTYIGNAYDCPITTNRAAGEDLRLVVQGASSSLSEIRVFVVESLDPDATGSIPLVDVRGSAYVNGQVITPSGPNFSEALWIAPPDDECTLYFVVRRAKGGTTSSTPTFQSSDDVVEIIDLQHPHGGGIGNGPGSSTEGSQCEIC